MEKTTAKTVLIVEDETKLARLLADYLHQAGFATVWVDNGLDALPRVHEHSPDLILLDLMLPGKDGLSLCREIRAFSTVPLIMLTARVEEIDRLLGLELGADDYICKPFSPREVVARVKAVLRRSEGEAAVISGLQLDSARQRATLDGQPLDLTTVEFRLLALLASHPGRLYSRQQLMENIYPDERIVCDRTVDSHIKKLRRKLAAIAPQRELIHSIYGAGYKFEPPAD
ncbi:MAG: response regulator [Desulfuromonadaceae bacterium]|nr:response regulator [Desulfuromonadaceae bacterium]